MKQKLLFQPQQIEIGSFSDRDEEPNYRERDSVPIDDCNRDYYARERDPEAEKAPAPIILRARFEGERSYGIR